MQAFCASLPRMAKKQVSTRVLLRDVEHDERNIRGKLEQVSSSISQTGLKEYTAYLSSPWRVFGMNLLAGTARGLGFVLGATVVVAVVVWIIGQVLGNLPIVGDFFQSMREVIQSGQAPGFLHGAAE